MKAIRATMTVSVTIASNGVSLEELEYQLKESVHMAYLQETMTGSTGADLLSYRVDVSFE